MDAQNASFRRNIASMTPGSGEGETSHYSTLLALFLVY
jgi:hypothetical protein